MDLQTILAEVETWPVADRLRLVQAVWDGIAVEEPSFELPDAAVAEIRHRLARDQAHPEEAISWEEVEAEALARTEL